MVEAERGLYSLVNPREEGKAEVWEGGLREKYLPPRRESIT